MANRKSNTVSVLVNLGNGTSAGSPPVMVSAQAEAGRVRISWYAPEARDLILTVYRRTLESDWARVGQPSLDRHGQILFEDRDVTPGARYGYRLLAQRSETQMFSSEVWVTASGGTPMVLRLAPSFPNPFASRTQLSYAVPRSGHVRLVVYDLQGRRITTVLDQAQTPGWRSVSWDGRDYRHREVASGTYFARLESGGDVQVRKIIVAR